MYRSIVIFLFFLSTTLVAQTNAVKKSRTGYSPATNAILTQMDSLFQRDTIGNTVYKDNNSKKTFCLEGKRVGYEEIVSDKFSLYAKLTKIATEKELLQLLANSNEISPIRGYALMAYVYQCKKANKKEQVFHYHFNVFVLSGCIGAICTYQQFNEKIRVRNFYDPDPHYFVRDANEVNTIKEENKIRQEQGQPLRKE